MWESNDESALWGVFPYRIAIPFLLVLALALTGLLVFSLQQWHSAVSDLLADHPEGIPRSDLIKLAVMTVLLGGTAVISLGILQHYRHTQLALSHIQELSRQILENMVSGIITLDLTGEITMVNPVAQQMLGFGPHHPKDLAWLRDQFPELSRVVKNAIEAENYVQDLDLESTAGAEGKSWLRVTVWPLVVGSRARVGVVVMLHDVTRLLAAERQLRRLDRVAATETLAAGVAHEVRNPLTAIDLNLRLLREEVMSRLKDAPDVSEYFDILTEETARLNRITEEFLAFSRPRSTVRRKVALASVMQRVARLLEREALEKKIAFKTNFEPDLPTIYGDPERLEQVFLNVLVNAMDAMPDGGEIQLLAVRSSSKPDLFVEAIVIDQGSGVAQEHLSRLFDPYFTTKKTGTGLGLAIAHRILADHDGDISIENSAAGGTLVRVRLPAGKKEAAEAPSGVVLAHERESISRG